MKKFVAVLLLVVVAFAAAPTLAFVAPAPALIPVDVFAASSSAPLDLFVHPVASAAIALPSYRIAEWLQLRRHSRAEWYRMRARGDGPETIGSGRLTRITPAADAKWLKAQERKQKLLAKARPRNDRLRCHGPRHR